MTRRLYCDLCIEPRGPEEARALARLLARLGYRLVAVEAEPLDRARALAEEVSREGLRALTRVTVEARDWAEAVKRLRRLQGYDLVAVRPRTAEAARLAARDPRVALVQLSPGMARYMDKSQALMLREGGAAAEIRLRPLLYGGDPRQALRGFMVIARRAAAYEAPLVVSSCARSPWEAWPPATVAGLLASMGIPPGHTRLMLGGYCRIALRKAGAEA